MTMLSRHARVIKPVTVVVAAGCLTVIAGCARGPSEVDWPEDPTPASVGPTTTSTDSRDLAAADEIIALVENYRVVEVASFAEPNPPHIARPILSNFLADPLLSEVLTTLNDMQRGGISFQGSPTSVPTVVEISMDDTPPTAVVRDCVNATDWQSVFVETGEAVPGDTRPDQYVAWLKVKLFPDGWLMYDSDVEEGAEC